MRFQKFKKRKEQCRKVRFRNRFEAIKRGKIIGLRPYPCDLCNGWHLTSSMTMADGSKWRGAE